MMGPGGKYDAEATALLRSLDAQALVLIVMGGKRGHGVTVTQELSTEWSVVAAAEFLAGLPHLLRSLADDIERDIAAKAGSN